MGLTFALVSHPCFLPPHLPLAIHIFPLSSGSSVLGTEDELAVSLRFMNFGSSPPSSDDDSGLSSFVENPQYFCGIIKEKDMCKSLTHNHAVALNRQNCSLFFHVWTCVLLRVCCLVSSAVRRPAHQAAGHRAEVGAWRGGVWKSLPGRMCQPQPR